MNHKKKTLSKSINSLIMLIKGAVCKISRLSIWLLYQDVKYLIILDNIRGKLSSRLNDKHIFS